MFIELLGHETSEKYCPYCKIRYSIRNALRCQWFGQLLSLQNRCKHLTSEFEYLYHLLLVCHYETQRFQAWLRWLFSPQMRMGSTEPADFAKTVLAVYPLEYVYFDRYFSISCCKRS